MRKLLLLALMLLGATSLLAQTTQQTASQNSGSLTLKLIDDAGNSVVGATVSLTNRFKLSAYLTSDASGECTFRGIAYGTHTLEVSYIGYHTISRSITLESDLLDLGEIIMREESTKIDEVSVMTNAIRTSQSGDTVIYNADAYKVAADAVAEGLLAKMPGITVDDGEVEAQGEEVKKVYLDGKEFFAEDVTIAIKNIPADIIAKVEVFNKLSDEAEFTGFDDGNSYKAINIVTRTGMNHGQFGKFTAGVATEGLYQLSASYNYFTGDHRLSIVGSSNNMNIKGFGSMSVGHSGGINSGGGRSGGGGGGGGGGRSMTSGTGSFSGASSGISSASGIGFNYGGSFLEEKLTVEASYFYNTSDNEVEKLTDRQYIVTDDDELQRYYNALSESLTNNYNHRINTRIEYKPNSRHSLMMRPEFAIQGSGSSSYSLADNTQTADGSLFEALNTIENLSSTDRYAYTVSNNLAYRVLLGASGRNLMFSASGSYSDTDSESLTDNTTTSEEEESLTKQNIFNGVKNYSVSSSLTYSEPIFNKSAMLTFKYNVKYNYSDADYLVYEWEVEDNLFNIDYDPESSNIYNSGYLTQNIGPGIMYSKPNDLQLNFNVSYQKATLLNEQEVPVVTPSESKYEFGDFVYSLMLRKTFSRTSNLRLMMNSSTNNPSIDELQDVVKDSDPQDVTSGNSSLEPSYSHTLKATYVHSNIYKGRTFMAMLSGGLTNNNISESTIMLINADDQYTLPNGDELAQFGEYTYPINLDGKWNLGANVSYGTPVNPLSSNINFDLSVNYSQTPSVINFLESITQQTTYSSGVAIGSNISQNVDFTLSYKGGYSVASYTGEAYEGTSTSNNEYLTHKASAQFKFLFWNSITLSGDATFSQYKGITDDFDESYTLCNIYIGKKIFKNQRGELSLGVNDLLNQTENFSRNITETYIENVVSNSIGRYFGIKLTYDLRRFNGRNTQMGGPEGRGGRGMDDGMGGGMGMGGMGGGGGRR